MTPKLLFLDLDGTVIWPGTFEMPASTEEALRLARENGHKIIICTGRNMGAIRPLLSHTFDGIIASAGGHVELDDRILQDLPLSHAEQEEAFRVLKESCFFITAETLEHMYIDTDVYSLLEKLGERSGNSELVRLRKQGDSRLHCRPLRDYAGEPVYKILLLCEEESQFEEPERILSDRYAFVKHEKDADGIVNGELISRRFSKGLALNLVARELGFDRSDTIAFGDSMNDVAMFREAGTAVCMGDGPDRLKAMAHLVCPLQREDGLYHAFHTLKLI